MKSFAKSDVVKVPDMVAKGMSVVNPHVDHEKLQLRDQISYQILKWRNQNRIRHIENEIRALEPLHDLWEIKHPERIIMEEYDNKKRLKLNKQKSELQGRDSASDNTARQSKDIRRGSIQPDVIGKHQAGVNVGVNVGATGGEKKAFEAAYNKVIHHKIDKEEQKVRDYAQYIRDRLALVQSKAVNPMIETFDMLHLQEISLQSKLLTIPQRVKNTRPMHAPINKTRKGGHQKRTERQFLDRVLKFGCMKPVKKQNERTTAKDVERKSIASTMTLQDFQNDVSVCIKDPILKLQKRYFASRNRSLQQKYAE